ncbi:MAG: hypothetical protein PHH65_06625 [Eubacteriales bacterium]|nr:hypothetical protein [Eubacteriales bacterium]
MIRAKTGSATVEAALIYPLVILLAAGLIRQELVLYEEVQSDCEIHREALISTLEPAGIDVCLLLRGQWLCP